MTDVHVGDEYTTQGTVAGPLYLWGVATQTGGVDPMAGMYYPTTPDGNDPTLPPVTTRAVSQYPYAANSIWNATLRDGVTYFAAGDTSTDSYRAVNGNINIGTDWNLGVWYPTTSDPLVNVVAASNTSTVYMQVRLPSNWVIPGPAAPNERDGWVTVIDPSGAFATDFYKMTAVGGTSSRPSYFTVTRAPANTDLTGAGLVMNTTGINTTTSTWGMRASTLSYPAGAVRRQEVLEKKFEHAIAVSIPGSALLSGYIWPARAQDSNADTAGANGQYTGGTRSSGTRLALPASGDIYAGLASDEGRALADALQTRGIFVVDRASGGAVITCERPANSGDDAYKAALGRLLTDWKVLTKRLVRVTGHTADLPGGPGNVRWAENPAGVVVPN